MKHAICRNRIRIQIMKLNPIRKEKAAKKRVRGKRKSSENEGKKDYPKAWGQPGDDLWASDEGLRQIILENADLFGIRQLLVPDLGTQLPMTEASVSMVLALLAVAPVVALAVVELLLPIMAVLSKNFAGMEDEREASLEQNMRKKMTVAE
jgi:hypothetical protein